MLRRVTRAFKGAAPVWLTMALAGAVILFLRWRRLAADPIAAVSIVTALTLVVFLTYFVLGLAGFRVSRNGVARVPRIVGWLIVTVVTVVVFGVLFYLLIPGR